MFDLIEIIGDYNIADSVVRDLMTKQVMK